jgi:hypothetical protein
MAQQRILAPVPTKKITLPFIWAERVDRQACWSLDVDPLELY